jgi:hypothetical protein
MSGEAALGLKQLSNTAGITTGHMWAGLTQMNAADSLSCVGDEH